MILVKDLNEEQVIAELNKRGMLKNRTIRVKKISNELLNQLDASVKVIIK